MLSWLQTVGLLSLWTVLLVRAPFVWRHRLQRTLWIAVALVAFCTSMYQQPVIRLVSPLLGSENIVDLVRHAIQIGSCVTIVLLFISAARLRWLHILRILFLLIVLAVVIILIIIVATSSPHTRVTSLTPGIPLTFWLVFHGFQIATDLSLAIVSALLVRDARSTLTRWTIGLFGISRVFSTMLWIIFWTANITHHPQDLRWIPLITGIEQIALSAAIVLPGVIAAVSRIHQQRQLRTIHSLWMPLTATVPEVVLNLHPHGRTCPRWWESTQRLALMTYRMVIEIHDAAAQLAPYADVQTRERARWFMEAKLPPVTSSPQAITACWLAAACRTYQDHRSAPDDAGVSTRVSDNTSLPEDLAYLTAVATVYQSALPAGFLNYLDTHPTDPPFSRV
jgi:hypothetical protein